MARASRILPILALTALVRAGGPEPGLGKAGVQPCGPRCPLWSDGGARPIGAWIRDQK